MRKSWTIWLAIGYGARFKIFQGLNEDDDMKKYKSQILACFIFAVGFLVGCGGTSPTVTPIPSEPTPTEPVVNPVEDDTYPYKINVNGDIITVELPRELTIQGRHNHFVVELCENEGVVITEMFWDDVSFKVTLPPVPYSNPDSSVEGVAISPVNDAINIGQYMTIRTPTLNLPAGSCRTVEIDGDNLIVVGTGQPDPLASAELSLSDDKIQPKNELVVTSEITPVPSAVMIDNVSSSAVTSGSPIVWNTAGEGHGGNLMWTLNNGRTQANDNWARWYPNLVPGCYEVLVFIPNRYTTTTSARYWVSHAAGATLRIVNQSINGESWVSLGAYWFDGTNDEYVSLSDVTSEPHQSRLIAFDAAKWTPCRSEVAEQIAPRP